MTTNRYHSIVALLILIMVVPFSSKAQNRRLAPEKWAWHPATEKTIFYTTGKWHSFSQIQQKQMYAGITKVVEMVHQLPSLNPARGFDTGTLASMDINPLLGNTHPIRNKFYEEPFIIDTLRGFPLYAGKFVVINKTKEANPLGVKKEMNPQYEIEIKKKELEHKKEVQRRFTLQALLNIHSPATRRGNYSGKTRKPWILKI